MTLKQETDKIIESLKEKVPNILLLGYGGSYAYGTNIETSDIDVRGFYQNPIDELLGIKPDSEQYCDDKTDSVVYSLKKLIQLLSNCNPNTIEILGLTEYLYMTPEAQLIIDNKDVFLSKRAIHTFGGYAASQLNRLMNKSGRGKKEALKNEERSLSKVIDSLHERYHKNGLIIKAYEQDNQLCLNINAENLPIERLSGIMNELNNVHRDYTKSKRNDKAIEHNKLNKHMMHLLRLYMMGIDILEKQEIITKRTEEHALLMAIRNNEFLKDDMMTPTKAFEKLLAEYTERFEKAAENTKLPEQPDYNKINDLMIQINKRILAA